MTDVQDLIDFRVGSPQLPRAASSSQQSPSPPEVEETLIDTDLPVLEQKLQTAPCPKTADTERTVDLEDILITIDEDEFSSDCDDQTNSCDSGTGDVGLTRSNSEILLDMCGTNIESEEAINVLMKLDEILNETMRNSNEGLDTPDSFPVTQAIGDGTQSISVESCLMDLDDYLKTFESSASEDGESVSGKLSSSEASHDLDSLGNCVEELKAETDLDGAGSYTNEGYENTEPEVPQIKRSPIRRSHSHRTAQAVPFRRSVIVRQSLGSGRISGPAGAMGLGLSGPETKRNGPISHADVQSLQSRAHPTADCCTGPVQVSLIVWALSRTVIHCCVGVAACETSS